MAEDRSKQSLCLGSGDGGDIVEVKVSTVGAKSISYDTPYPATGYNEEIPAGKVKLSYKDADGKRSEWKDVPAFIANPATTITAVTLSQATMALKVGGKKTLSATVLPEDATVKDVKYTSEDVKIATVNATTGEITAIAVGTTNVIASSLVTQGVTGKCAVTVSAVA